MTHHLRTLTLLTSGLLLTACAGFMPPQQVSVDVAPQWQAPLPHGGMVSSLTDWWKNQGDPVLVELIAAAQAASPTVSQARTRIAQARANQSAANAALAPQVNAQYGASRGVTLPETPVITSQQLGLQASWEVDLIGINRAVGKATEVMVENSRAQWHDARVSVAAEVANLYFGYGTCRQLLDLAQRDAASREDNARLTDAMAHAGFTAPAIANLARASAADAQGRAHQQAAQCDLQVKGLVALTALPEPDLRQKLALASVKPAQEASISIASVPAQTIAQRPDVFTAERAVLLASVDVGVAKAQRLPQLTITGNIAGAQVSTGNVQTKGTVWSFGPVALTLPVFDSGQRRANVEASKAAYDTAVVRYKSTVRQAVREVEEAMVTLHSTQTRSQYAHVASSGYTSVLQATQSRYDHGFASLPDLEDARRNAWAAQSNLLNVQLERQQAWVALYRALGGGFEPRLAQAEAP